MSCCAAPGPDGQAGRCRRALIDTPEFPVAYKPDASGNSHISMEAYAIALVDELETLRHSRQRFSVAY